MARIAGKAFFCDFTMGTGEGEAEAGGTDRNAWLLLCVDALRLLFLIHFLLFIIIYYQDVELSVRY